MTILYLLCVGESTWTRFHRLEGMRDISLSAKGRLQMINAAKQLQQYPISKIYYARTTRGMQAAKLVHECWTQQDPLVRQIQKSQKVKAGKSVPGFVRGKYYSLSKRNQFATVKLVRESRLNDLNYGTLQGLFPEEIEIRHARVMQTWIENPVAVEFPQGESVLSLINRTKELLNDLQTHELYPPHYLLITHEPVIQVMTSQANSLPIERFRDLTCTPGHFTVIQYGL